MFEGPVTGNIPEVLDNGEVTDGMHVTPWITAELASKLDSSALAPAKPAPPENNLGTKFSAICPEIFEQVRASVVARAAAVATGWCACRYIARTRLQDMSCGFLDDFWLGFWLASGWLLAGFWWPGFGFGWLSLAGFWLGWLFGWLSFFPVFLARRRSVSGSRHITDRRLGRLEASMPGRG